MTPESRYYLMLKRLRTPSLPRVAAWAHVECVAEWSHHHGLSMPSYGPPLILGLLLPSLGLRAALGHLGHTIANPSLQCASLHPQTSAYLVTLISPCRLCKGSLIPPCATLRSHLGFILEHQTSDTYSFSMPSPNSPHAFGSALIILSFHTIHSFRPFLELASFLSLWQLRN